jgi:tetratricopeptide (TPR) repeat protein
LATASINKAFELRDRVSERERYRIAGDYYSIGAGDVEKAIQADKLWAQSYPRDDLAPLELGNEYMLLGQWERALSETQESLRLEQNDVVAYGNLGQIFLALNRLDEAKATFRQALVRKLDGWELRLMMYYLAFLGGDAEEMKQQVEWSGGRPGSEDIFLSAQSDSEAYYGHMRNARDFSRRAVESVLRGGAKETAATWQVDAALRNAEIGNGEQARQQSANALTISSGNDVRKLAALALARGGDTAHADATAEGLARSNPANTLLNYYWLATIRAAIELNHKNPAKAIELLQPAGAYELGYSLPFQVGTMYPAYMRGEAYLALHQGSQAATEYQKILDHRGIVLNFPIGALAHLGLARAYVLQGDTAKARAAYQDFLALWKDADTDIPVLIAAKAEYAKLK